MQRVVAILEAVSAAGRPTTAARVSEQISLSLSTVSRIMRELAAEEMLERVADDAGYVLGPRVFNLVSNAAARGDRGTAINRELQALRDLSGETASLHVRRGDQRVCIASVMSSHELRRVIPVGDAAPLVGTVPGDVLLIDASNEDRDELLRATMAEARTDALGKMRFAVENDYAVYGLEQFGIAAIAVPVRVDGQVRCALALSGPLPRFAPVTAQSWLPDLRRAAVHIEPWVSQS